MDSGWSIDLLHKRHDRSAFDCGKPSLNEYLKRYATQNARRGVGKTYVATPVDAAAVAGYYSLCTGSIDFANAPPKLVNRLPKYPISTVHLARLAVDLPQQGVGLGGILLVDALVRCASVGDKVGVRAVSVDAKDDEAAGFYGHFGFESLKDSDLHLYLLMDTARQLIAE